MEKEWEINADGLYIKVVRYSDTVRMVCISESPGVLFHRESVLTVQQSKKIEAIFRAANRAAAGEGKP